MDTHQTIPTKKSRTTIALYVFLILSLAGALMCLPSCNSPQDVLIDPQYYPGTAVLTQYPVPNTDPVRYYVLISDEEAPPNVPTIPVISHPSLAENSAGWLQKLPGGPWSAAGIYLASQLILSKRSRKAALDGIVAALNGQVKEAAKTPLVLTGWAHTKKNDSVTPEQKQDREGGC